MIYFNYYAANIKKSQPLGMIDLITFFDKIRNPKPEIRLIFDQIKQAEMDGNAELKGKLKEQLFSFTPCVRVKNNRSYAEIQAFTGLMVLDFDHLEPNYAKEFKLFLFNEYPFIIATWLSASKCGVRALVNIPKVADVEEFQQLFNGLAHSEMAQYSGFDFAPKNPVLPLFLSYDPDIMTGDTESIWEGKYFSEKSKPIKQYKLSRPDDGRVEKIIKSAIDKVDSNGHPQLRSASRALGGYVGAGYIDYSDAIYLIESLIDTNAYLSQKAATYKKTAKTMIESGSNFPLFIKD